MIGKSHNVRIDDTIWKWAEEIGRADNSGAATTIRSILIEAMANGLNGRKKPTPPLRWIKCSVHEECYHEALTRFKAEAIETPNATPIEAQRKSICQCCNKIVRAGEDIIVVSLPEHFIATNYEGAQQ
jgi:hypothetical protein